MPRGEETAMSINDLFLLGLVLAATLALRFSASRDWVVALMFGVLGGGAVYHLLAVADLLPVAMAR